MRLALRGAVLTVISVALLTTANGDDGVRFFGGPHDGWDRNTMAGAQGLGGAVILLSSGEDQSFVWTHASGDFATLTITAEEVGDPAALTNGATMRVRLPTAWEGRFDTSVTEPMLGGSAHEGNKVDVMGYSGNGRILEIVVTDDFMNGDVLTIAGLRLLDLHLCRGGTRHLALDFTGDGEVNSFDQYTVQMLVPYPGGSHDGWDRDAMLTCNEIWTPRGTLFLIR